MTTKGLASLVTLVVLGAASAGCSDSVPPAPQGAARYNFTSPRSGGNCNKPLDTNAGLGAVTGVSFDPKTNEEDNITVSCRVKQNENGSFTFSASIANKETSFSIAGTVSSGEDGTAKVQSYTEATLAKFTSTQEMPCTVSVTPTSTATGLGIAPGKIWGSFSCERLVPTENSNSGTTCAIVNSNPAQPGGYFVFQNCDEE